MALTADPSPARDSAGICNDGTVTYPAPASPAPPSPPPAPAQPAGASTGLGVSSLVVGIVAVIAGWVPVLGLILGIVAVILGGISLAKRRARGFSISGIILGAVAALISLAVTIFLIVGFATFERGLFEGTTDPPSPSPSAQPLSEEELSEFVDVDDATLAEIMNDPATYAEMTLIIYGSFGEPLILAGPDGEELCLMEFTPSATPEGTPGEQPFERRAAAIADGTLYECAMIDEFVSPGAGALSSKKMWVIVAGTTLPKDGDDGESDLVIFGVAQIE